jgi:hypothetical protein
MFTFEATSFMASKRSENGKGPLPSMLRQQRSRSFLLRCMIPVVALLGSGGTQRHPDGMRSLR